MAQAACSGKIPGTLVSLPEGGSAPVEHISPAVGDLPEHFFPITPGLLQQRLILENAVCQAHRHQFIGQQLPAQLCPPVFRAAAGVQGQSLDQLGVMGLFSVANIGSIGTGLFIPEILQPRLYGAYLFRQSGGIQFQIGAELFHPPECQQIEQLQGAFRRVRRVLPAAETRPPLVKIPVPRQCVHPSTPELAVKPAQDRGSHSQHLPAKGQITAVAAVLFQSRYKYQRETGNIHLYPGRGAQFQQSILPQRKGQGPQALPGLRKLAKGIVARKHLIAGVHSVQSLLPPGAILIMLVHRAAESMLGHREYLIHQTVGAFERAVTPNGVFHFLHTHMIDRHIVAVEEQLQIAAAQAQEPVDKPISPGSCLPAHRKVPATHIGPHPQVIQMLTKTDIHPGSHRTDCVYVQIAHRFRPQIQDQVDTVRLIGRKPDTVARHQVILRHIGQLLPLPERKGSKLLQAAFMGGKHTLAAQTGCLHCMDRQFRNGPEGQITRLIHRHSLLPGLCRLI